MAKIKVGGQDECLMPEKSFQRWPTTNQQVTVREIAPLSFTTDFCLRIKQKSNLLLER